MCWVTLVGWRPKRNLPLWWPSHCETSAFGLASQVKHGAQPPWFQQPVHKQAVQVHSHSKTTALSPVPRLSLARQHAGTVNSLASADAPSIGQGVAVPRTGSRFGSLFANRFAGPSSMSWLFFGRFCLSIYVNTLSPSLNNSIS